MGLLIAAGELASFVLSRVAPDFQLQPLPIQDDESGFGDTQQTMNLFQDAAGLGLAGAAGGPPAVAAKLVADVVAEQLSRELEEKPPGLPPLPQSTTRDPIQQVNAGDNLEERIQDEILAQVKQLVRKGLAQRDQIVTEPVGSHR